MILLASGVAQFFVFLFALNAVLFVVAFLWNIRQMKLINYLGAVRFFMGLGAAAIITFWLVIYVDRDNTKKPLPATDLESTNGRPNPTERAIPTAPGLRSRIVGSLRQQDRTSKILFAVHRQPKPRNVRPHQPINGGKRPTRDRAGKR